jgi:hypothetical protein
MLKENYKLRKRQETVLLNLNVTKITKSEKLRQPKTARGRNVTQPSKKTILDYQAPEKFLIFKNTEQMKIRN